MKQFFIVVLVALNFSLARSESFLIEKGVARSEIIIAENPSRTIPMAARDLQIYLEKICGVKVTIGTKPTSDFPVKIYVGQSPFTEKLGITSEGLEDGAYRIVSGDNWIVLIGDDTNFVPIEPWPRNNTDIASGKMQREWDKITGQHWGYPHSQLHKHYSGSNSRFGTPGEQLTDKDGNVNVWTFDERGSFNAVAGLLRDLGVRWYMPGEIGEIVPKLESIALPKIDQTVKPDFPMRILNFRGNLYGHDAMMWAFRLGLRQPYWRQAAHGLDRMTQNEYYLKNKPEWFALYGGKRHNELGKRLNQLCYSNEELLAETVAFARAQFDHYDMDVVSIMPPDGYTAICQCDLCEGKDEPERGYRGQLTNYVWGFVNRVAKEVGKSHPGKLISNCAYGVYTDPPTNIDKLEPNVQVIIVGGRRPTLDRPEEREQLRTLRAGWGKLTDRPIEIFENYPFTGRNFYLPAYIPRAMGESINETKGTSRGEDIWLTMDFKENAIGYNHFLIYFTARMYWGGKNQDATKLFDEYCGKFYGPAAGKEMKAFFAYCENNWREMENDAEKAQQALALFAAAKAKETPDTIYGQRIGLVDKYLNGLRRKSVQLSQKRGPVPRLRLVGGDPLAKIVVDGKLDDKAWQGISVASTGKMRELETGRIPIFGTSIMTLWQGGSLYFGVRCDENPGDPPNIATTRDGDQAIWYGDVVEFLIDTDSHHYYQIAVNPAGAVVNIDRAAERAKWMSWESQAEVATQVGDDYWTVEIRIPVTSDENDPLHQVIGRKPTQSLPWYINVCRQRIRKSGSELSAFSPTGTKGFHEPMKFAHFYRGLSHQFEVDASVSDYVIAKARADQLYNRGKREESRAAYLDLTKIEKVTDLQKSDALYHAARSARANRDLDQAEEMASKIPLPSVAAIAEMETMLEQRKWAELIEKFGEIDFATWPFTEIGAGAFARGRAHVFTKNGKAAEADLQLALTYTSNSRIRPSILAVMGNNRETYLKDDAGALEAYRENFIGKTSIGAADEFRSVQSAARILSRQEKFDEALATIDRITMEKLTGYWRTSSLLVKGGILEAAGRGAEAAAIYNGLLEDDQVDEKTKEAAREALRKGKVR